MPGGNGTGSGAVGAYGLRLRGVQGANGLLVPSAPAWPEVEIVFREGTATPRERFLVDDEGAFPLGDGMEVVAHRGQRQAVYTAPRPIPAAEFVHPFLTAGAAMFAWWEGYDLFHASAFVASGAAWALLGEPEAGKSSTVAWLNQRGYDIVCDDLLVVGGNVACAGPRFIDLRPDAAPVREGAVPLAIGGARERWRLTLPAIAPEVPLGGWIFLTWAEELELVPIPVTSRVERLARQRSWRSKMPDPVSTLHLAALPMWELRRPRAWSSQRVATDLVLEAVSTERGA